MEKDKVTGIDALAKSREQLSCERAANFSFALGPGLTVAGIEHYAPEKVAEGVKAGLPKAMAAGAAKETARQNFVTKRCPNSPS